MSRPRPPPIPGSTLIVAFNYGGKAEITDATRLIARDVAAGTPQSRRHHRGHHRACALYPWPPRSRPDHPHQRRTAHFQFPALAGGLFGIRLRRRKLARFRRGQFLAGARDLFPARPALWWHRGEIALTNPGDPPTDPTRKSPPHLGRSRPPLRLRPGPDRHHRNDALSGRLSVRARGRHRLCRRLSRMGNHGDAQAR